MILELETPKWAYSLLKPYRYKGISGGRGSGKSHFYAECIVEKMVLEPDTMVVCIREIQKSLKFSAKKLIEDKIEALQVAHYFDITLTEIRAKQGKGLIIFQGMQDHTAESIKSLEGFNIAWVEEAQSLSERSLTLLRPTIRAQGSELWFSWNPENDTDPVDVFFNKQKTDAIHIHVNSENNPFLPETLRNERESDKIRMSSTEYDHVWNGAYNILSDAFLFNKASLNFYEQIDESLIDARIAFVDVADQGTDSLSMAIGYIIQDLCYIVDVIHSKEGSNYTIPLVAAKIKEHRLDRCVIESNAMGYIFGRNVQERVTIDLDIIPTKGNKHHRIVANSEYVKKYFLFRQDYEKNSDYDKFMLEVYKYTKDGKAKHDDAPDSLTGLALLKRELFD